MCRCFITSLPRLILREERSGNSSARVFPHLALQLEHLRMEHQVNGFMGCDHNIENWWKWLKAMYKIKEPMSRSAAALPVQIVGAFVTDLLLRAFKHSSGFTSSLYEFVTRCQEASLTALSQLPANSALRQALEAILKLLNGQQRHLQLVA